MHIPLQELGFTEIGIGILTGAVETVEVPEEDLAPLEAMSANDQADYLLRNIILSEEKKSGGASDQGNSTAKTKNPEKDSVMNQRTAPIDSSNLTYAQIQSLAILVHMLNPDLEPAYIVQELDAWRGTKTLDKLATDIANVLHNAVDEITAED